MSIAPDVQGVNVPPAGEYEIDPQHSMVGFVVRHLMVSKVRGRFNTFTGTLHVADNPAESKVAVEIDLASIDTGSDQRDEHLRSADFFDVTVDPTMSFTATGMAWSGNETGRVTGDLTLHGVTRPLTLDFEYLGAITDPMAGGTRIGLSAVGTLDREEFGLTYNAALDGGGVMIGKNITLELEVEAQILYPIDLGQNPEATSPARGSKNSATLSFPLQGEVAETRNEARPMGVW